MVCVRDEAISRAPRPRQRSSCRIEIFALCQEALAGIEQSERLEMLYWLHLSRRDFVRQNPANDGSALGTFALRAPVRPNLIGISIATLIGIEGTTVLVRGFDCLDGTPPLDLKPDRTLFTPIAPATTGRL
ncbi:SAM-dependent methyltransferase [Mesorhizobium retamae]|uniref:SAM-dependent methyltransferase n=1 Tax=Mesorhizobium retamae TaxID=2912854 RepID=UPI003CCFE77F